MLSPRGGIECDFTVTRLAQERFRIVTGTAFGQHDLSWIREHAPDGIAVDDVTSAYTCLGLWGPASRDILQPLTVATANTTFPYMRAREVAVGPVPVSRGARDVRRASSGGSSTVPPSSASRSGT